MSLQTAVDADNQFITPAYSSTIEIPQTQNEC